VVDDNATNRRILEETLLGWGMRPTLAENAPTALAELRRAEIAGEPYPLILLDAQMPEVDGFTLASQIKGDSRLADTVIVMLTSMGHPSGTGCWELGLAAYLVKPIKQSELMRTIRTVLVTARPVVKRAVAPLAREGRSPVEAFAPSQRLRVLVADDNPVNRLVATRMLETQGYAVSVAGDGRQALNALEQERFDVVLLDVQMPELDGFEVAASIRALELGTTDRLPLIAVTAHAMKGDQERCLAAGMDGYLAKPIQKDQLLQVIGDVLRGGSAKVQRVSTSVAKD
jgi:CheY-like chemotaxis protein